MPEADACSDQGEREHLLEMESRWLHIARSYEFVASLEQFLLDWSRNRLPHEVESLPKTPPDL